MPHQYYPGADRREIFRVFEFAADKDVPIYTHVRSMGAEAMQEVIADAAAEGDVMTVLHLFVAFSLGCAAARIFTTATSPTKETQ